MGSVISLLAVALFAFGGSPLPPEYAQARALYYQGADGNKDAYTASEKLFAALDKRHPGDPRVKVYSGSLRLQQAAHTWAIWKKYSLSKEGIQLMDESVTAAPQSLEVRFVRAVTTYRLPGFFHRRDQSREDFEYLARQAEPAARSGALEPRLAAASLYYHGEFLCDSGQQEEAAAAWRKAIALAPGSRAANESRDALKRKP